MEAPPVQYVTTSDGFSIAYTVSGAGPTLVYMPFAIGSLGHSTNGAWGQNPQLSQLRPYVRLVRYDNRGQGLSTRGLDHSHSLQAYERDLEAVVERLQPERVVLMGGNLSSHVAVRYGARHPERIRALVLYRTGITQTTSATLNLGLAENDWHLFLHSLLNTVQANEEISPEERRHAVETMKDSVDQADWLHYARIAQDSTIEADLPLLQTPALVLATGGHLTILREGAAKVASLIPNARLVSVDESATLGATAQPVLDFLTELPAIEDATSDTRRQIVPGPGLSTRELEVLRLVAAGKSSREIGEELVLSRRTVERHIANIYLKTETHGRAQLATYALRNRLT
jgi:pimeloyl-ACP methyl ester carboxylesterase